MLKPDVEGATNGELAVHREPDGRVVLALLQCNFLQDAQYHGDLRKTLGIHRGGDYEGVSKSFPCRGARAGQAHRLAPRPGGAIPAMTADSGQWEFLQTRAVKWKWRQVGDTGTVLSESAEFSFLAQCMQDAERNGFCLSDHVINCDKGAALWSDPPERPV